MNRSILRLAIPNILSNLSVPLLGMVDTALMGRMETEIYIGAIALGTILFNFIYWGFGFLRMGTTGMTAQAYGQGDHQESISILGRALLVALAGSLLIIILQKFIGRLGFDLIQGDAAVKDLARSYFYIRIYAAPATLALYAFHGWFLGMQNARYPMWLTIFVNLLNIGFNLIFIYMFNMKSDGVALGTVCAQYTGLLLAILLFLRKYRNCLPRFKVDRVIQLSALRRFFSVNSDIFIRTICLIFAFAFFTSASAGIGSLALAANQILLQYFYLMAFGTDGFAFAAESLVGRFKGAGEPKQLRRAVKLLFFWGCGLGIIFALVYAAAGNNLLRLFTDQTAVIEAALPYVWWMILIPPAGAVAFMWDGVYIGATATKPMRNTMLLATLVFFLPVYYLSFPAMGNHGLWLAMLVFMLARAILLSLTARKHIFIPINPAATTA